MQRQRGSVPRAAEQLRAQRPAVPELPQSRAGLPSPRLRALLYCFMFLRAPLFVSTTFPQPELAAADNPAPSCQRLFQTPTGYSRMFCWRLLPRISYEIKASTWYVSDSSLLYICKRTTAIFPATVRLQQNHIQIFNSWLQSELPREIPWKEKPTLSQTIWQEKAHLPSSYSTEKWATWCGYTFSSTPLIQSYKLKPENSPLGDGGLLFLLRTISLWIKRKKKWQIYSSGRSLAHRQTKAVRA